ncbi:MAG: ribulokinase [Pseudoxanthomonas suwonensis]|nr:MAG: ribulokinase [Pseudoxanthomonas suwonensis]
MPASTTYVLGIDFGTESARAVLVRLTDGAEIATAVHPYQHGVMDETLTHTGAKLPPDTAMQDPDDYLASLQAVVRSVVSRSRVDPEQVIGLGIDTTACTLVLTDAQLVPLPRLTRWRSQPLAYARLWKHHAAQQCAEELIAAAEAEGGMFLPQYGGRLSSEWLLPKALQTLREAPEVYAAAERILEQQDWIVSTLVGHEVRSAAVAGYKGTYRAEGEGYPSAAFLNSVHDGFASVLDKVGHEFLAPGAGAGTLSGEWAEKLGLSRHTTVATGNIDAHAAVLGSGVVDPGVMVAVMGTSVCNLIVTDDYAEPVGIQGVVLDGILPGKWGYEAGQAGFGDTFGWFVRHLAGADVADNAAITGRSVFEVLEEQAAALNPGGSGLMVLDWLSGNRSILIDSNLSGAVIGLTLATRSHHLYRALLEAAAFGQKVIVEAFEQAGVNVDRFVVSGGIPRKSPLLMQILADVTGRRIEVSPSSNSSALGAALHAAIAAGAKTWKEAAGLAPSITVAHNPDPERTAAYESLYTLYRKLHDDLGVTSPQYMHELRRLQAQALDR